MSDFTRREFLGTGSAALAGFGMSASDPRSASADDSVPPSDQLRFGAIGINGMGWNNTTALRAVDGVECVALCDVDRNVLEDRAAELEDVTGERPDLYGDYRRLLEDDDIDFVVIGTPDHWHCLQTIHACEAGKDVYVEKPLANSIGECLLMEEAVEKHGRVVQVGQWQRSSAHWQKAVEYLQSGALGTIRHTKAWAYMGWMDHLAPKPNQDPPDGVDYDMWLGPAPERPFNPNRFHFDFRWFWDYAGGLMTDWGVHLIDYVFKGMEVGGPNAVMSSGGKFGDPDGAAETPDTQQAIYTFDDFSMTWEHAVGIGEGPYEGRGHGVAFIGNNGTLVIDRSGWEVYPEVDDDRYKTEALPPRSGEGNALAVHAENFVAAIREGEALNCPVDAAANTAINAHLGNVAYKLGRAVTWDAEKHRFVDDAEANEHVWLSYRDPWTLPQS